MTCSAAGVNVLQTAVGLRVATALSQAIAPPDGVLAPAVAVVLVVPCVLVAADDDFALDDVDDELLLLDPPHPASAITTTTAVASAKNAPRLLTATSRCKPASDEH
jgi:hypothetical protein